MILGCTGQAIEVRWLIDLTRLLLSRHVRDIPLVTLALALACRTCHVELRVGSVSGSPAGSARTVCVPALGVGDPLPFPPWGWQFAALSSTQPQIFPYNMQEHHNHQTLPSLKTELEFASRFRSSKGNSLLRLFSSFCQFSILMTLVRWIWVSGGICDGSLRICICPACW